MLGVLLIAATACGGAPPTDPLVAGLNAPSLSLQSGVVVCHATGSGRYVRITISGSALPAHRAHGDAQPGEPVPGVPGYEFNSDCVPTLVPTDLTGVWNGAYTWNCGGTLTGSSPIQFVLTDPGDGSISGTVTYLGGTADLIANDPFQASSRRISNPMFRGDGTLLGGTTDPNGMWAILVTAGAAGFFVNNEFDGQIGTDFRTITGGTVNGDSPVLGSAGCSAPQGYSGSFAVSR